MEISFDRIPIPVIITDCDFTKGPWILYYNPSFLERVGEKIRSLFLKKTKVSVREIMTLEEYNWDSIRKMLSFLRKGQSFYIHYIHKEETKRIFLGVNAYPVADESGKLWRILYFFHEIGASSLNSFKTKKKRAERTLYKALLEISAPYLKPSIQMPQILDIFSRGFGAEYAVYYSRPEIYPNALWNPFLEKPDYMSQEFQSESYESFLKQYAPPSLLEAISSSMPSFKILKGLDKSLVFIPAIDKTQSVNGILGACFSNWQESDFVTEFYIRKFSHLIQNYMERYRKRKELEIYWNAIQQSSDGILITDGNLEYPAPKILYVNDSFCAMTGYSREELIGQSPRLFQGANTSKELLENLKMSLKDSGKFTGTAINYRKDGSEYYVHWDIHPIRNSEGRIQYYISFQRDITNEILSEKKFYKLMKYEIAIASISQLLLQQNANYNLIEDTLDQILLFMDIKIAVIASIDPLPQSAHLAPVRILHYRQKKNSKIEDLYLPKIWIRKLISNLPIVSHRYEKAEEDEATFYSNNLWEMAALIPFHYKADTIFFLLVADTNPKRFWEEEDILMLRTSANQISAFYEKQDMWDELKSHRDRLQELVEEKTASLELALKKAELASKAKSNFLANMSHELRTPLNSILGFSKLIQPSNETEKKYLEYIQKSGTHLLNLINEILDMSRIESGKLEMKLDPISILPILETAIESLIPQLEKKNLRIRREFFAFPTPPRILGEEKRLQQIFLNILSNAVKFSNSGTEIEISIRKIQKNSSYICIGFKNYGMGIRDEDRERIFEKFVQIQSGKESQGTGLGLSITKLLTEAMKGSIHVESVYGEYAEFILEFPLTCDSVTLR